MAQLAWNCAKFEAKNGAVLKTAPELRQQYPNGATLAMPSSTDILNSIQVSANGLTLTELLARHPDIARRTAQRLIAKLIESGQISALGEGRARRYFGTAIQAETSPLDTNTDSFPSFIPLSADSRDILAYINQPQEARKPVGYQRDFLDTYQPNVTSYLPESLRRQLHRMGKTVGADGKLTHPAD